MNSNVNVNVVLVISLSSKVMRGVIKWTGHFFIFGKMVLIAYLQVQ